MARRFADRIAAPIGSPGTIGRSPRTLPIGRDFPHIVEMAVPRGGFGKRLNDMHEWHRARGIEPQRGRGRHEDECDYIRWRFSDPDIAAAFAAKFGGTLQSSA